MLIKSEESEPNDENPYHYEDAEEHEEPTCSSNSNSNNSSDLNNCDYYPNRSKKCESSEYFQHNDNVEYTETVEWKPSIAAPPVNGFVKTEMLNGGYFERDLVKKENNFISDMVARCTPESK